MMRRLGNSSSTSNRTISMEEVFTDSHRRLISLDRNSMTKQDIRNALVAFYYRYDPARIPVIDSYFMSWIEVNGIDSFNDLLYLKYGKTIPIDGSHSSRSLNSPPTPPRRKRLPHASTKERSPPWDLQYGSALLTDALNRLAELSHELPPIDFEQVKLPLIGTGCVLVLLSIRYLYGLLATTNVILLCVGIGITSHHILAGSKRKALSSVLHVYWLLYCFSNLWESLLPRIILERWEYPFLKSMLFVYIFLPNRMFNEDGGGTVVRVQLVTIVRDLGFFFVEVCLLLYFINNADGRLRFREISVLVGLGLIYVFGVKTLKNRDRVIEEIYLTENQFASHMRAFRNAYVPALAGVITTEEMEILTRHLEPILALSELFSQELRKAMAKDLVGPAFEKFIPFFKMYAPFCADHETKRELVQKLRDKREIAEILYQVSSPPLEDSGKPKVQAIDSYLIMPVQRVPRYVLLLNEVIKKTPSWHPDYDNCVRVQEQMNDVAKFVNEAIAAHANLAQHHAASRNPLVRLGLSRTDSSSSSIAATTT